MSAVDESDWLDTPALCQALASAAPTLPAGALGGCSKLATIGCAKTPPAHAPICSGIGSAVWPCLALWLFSAAEQVANSRQRLLPAIIKNMTDSKMP